MKRLLILSIISLFSFNSIGAPDCFWMANDFCEGAPHLEGKTISFHYPAAQSVGKACPTKDFANDWLTNNTNTKFQNSVNTYCKFGRVESKGAKGPFASMNEYYVEFTKALDECKRTGNMCVTDGAIRTIK